MNSDKLLVLWNTVNDFAETGVHGDIHELEFVHMGMKQLITGI